MAFKSKNINQKKLILALRQSKELTKLKHYFTNLDPKLQKQLIVACFVLIFAIVGTIALIASHAASPSPYASVNADKGTICGGATIQTDSTSSDGSKVTFGPTTGSTCGSGATPTNTVQPYFTASTVNSTTGSCSAGCAIEGQQLSVTPGTWTNTPTSYTYQWEDCTTTAGTSTGIPPIGGGGTAFIMTPPTTGSCNNATGTGATTSTYTVGSGDVGKTLTVIVTALNSEGNTSTTPIGSCDTGLMTTTWNSTTNALIPTVSTYFNNGQPGCSPISAVVGTGQFGTGTAGEHFCTNAPTTCGFADIANTGPLAGTTLYAVPGTCTSPSGPGPGCSNTGSGWSYSGGTFTLSSDATLKDVVYHGSGSNDLNLSGLNDVTIEDNVLTLTGPSIFIINVPSGTGDTIEHNDLSGMDASTAGDGCDGALWGDDGSATNVTFIDNNVWFCSSDINAMTADSGWTISDNYMHDFAYADPGKSNHFDGIQWEGNGASGGAAYFVNNTFLMDVYQTSPVIISNDNDEINNARMIIHDLLAGGDACVYGYGKDGYASTNTAFENIDFSQIYMGDHNAGNYGCATYGTDAYSDFGTGGNVWSNNYWDDTGQNVSP